MSSGNHNRIPNMLTTFISKAKQCEYDYSKLHSITLLNYFKNCDFSLGICIIYSENINLLFSFYSNY